MNNRLSLGTIVMIVIVLLLLYGTCSNSSSSYSSSSSSSSNRRSGLPPTCPPVNRELPMSKETADRLSGTGYGGCRPGSSAENTMLSAAQLKCKNCGYHTDNGTNSYCDYCKWMQRYGGGLPTSSGYASYSYSTKAPRATAKPKATTSKDDPYRASDYAHADDFYYDHWDDFIDFEEAEDYYDEHH